MEEFYIPAGPGEAEFTEKRSRFLGHVRPVENEEQARDFIAAMKRNTTTQGTTAGAISSAAAPNATATTGSLRAPPAYPCWRSSAGRAYATWCAW